MSRWFRHYAGMMRDEKIVSAAVKSRQPVERVAWVWGAILESASEIDDAGRYELDPAEAAYFLRTDEADIISIMDALANAGRVSAGVVVKWGDRQYQSDKSADRQARYRERQRQGNRDGDAGNILSDGSVTSRDGMVTPPDTDTDTERKKEAPPTPKGAGAVDFDLIESGFPRSPHYNQAKAERAFRRLSPEDQQWLSSKAKAFGAWWSAEQVKRKRTMADSLPFAPPLDKWIAEGAWRSFEASLAGGTPDPELVVLKRDDPLCAALAADRGKALVFGDRGTVTVRRDEVEKARARMAA